mmetsp:Transcript_35545/g.68130  ORF Transcript_35545/g.68130 Transcript_35545/m.68130 type:complete len:296 (-) Transcript_35545:269-1156(-)
MQFVRVDPAILGLVQLLKLGNLRTAQAHHHVHFDVELELVLQQVHDAVLQKLVVARLLVLQAQSAAYGAMQVQVVLHHHHVPKVHQEQDDRLPHLNPVGRDEAEKHRKHNQPEGIVGAVAEERPPLELQGLGGGHGAHADDKQHVEHRRAHDGPEPHRALGEGANQGREQLRGGSSRRHERRPGHVVVNVPPLHQRLQCRNKVLVAHDGERKKHVQHPKGEQHQGSVVELVAVEHPSSKQRVVFGVACVGACLVVLRSPQQPAPRAVGTGSFPRPTDNAVTKHAHLSHNEYCSRN